LNYFSTHKLSFFFYCRLQDYSIRAIDHSVDIIVEHSERPPFAIYIYMAREYKVGIIYPEGDALYSF